jgi:tetratricopeptide (TPR) repeat protein
MNSDTPSQPLNQLEIPAIDIAESLLAESLQKSLYNTVETALEYCQAALAIYRDIGERFGEACTLNNLGNLYQSQAFISYSQEIFKEFDNAQEKTQSNLENSVKSKPNWFVPGINGNISIYSSSREGDPPRTPPITDPPSIMNAGDRLLEKSRQQYEDKNFVSALQSCQEVLTIYREISDRLGEACGVNNVGNIYQIQAAESYSQALAIFRELGNEAGEQETKQNLEQPLQFTPRWFRPSSGGSFLIFVGFQGAVSSHRPPFTDPEFTRSNFGNDPNDPGNVA